MTDPQQSEHEPTTRERLIDVWAKAAAGWRRWEPHLIAFSTPVTARMIALLEFSGDEHLLDIGCGFGDPATTIAQTLSDGGRVTAIDPVPEMIETARSRATALGLDNVQFHVAAIEDFECADRVDAISARWSFIFCEDIVAAFARARSWLKPGGRLVVAAWTPLKRNPGFLAINEALNSQADLPPVDPAQPGMMQLSEPGQFAGALREAGFRDVQIEEVPVPVFARDGAEFWDMMSEIGGSMAKVLRTFTPDQRAETRRRVIEAVSKHAASDVLRIPAVAQVALAFR